MAKTWMRLIVLIACYLYIVAYASVVSINFSMSDVKRLPRFWVNTGFAPPAPLETVDEFFGSNDVQLNLEIIGSLPNNGIKYVRIHWLLNLLSIIR